MPWKNIVSSIICCLCRYRLSVLRTLPNLEKLDDKEVLPEEVQTAMAMGRPLVHPLEMDTSPQSDAVTPDVRI